MQRLIAKRAVGPLTLTLGRVLAVGSVAVLAACGSTTGPAPVVHREAVPVRAAPISRLPPSVVNEPMAPRVATAPAPAPAAGAQAQPPQNSARVTGVAPSVESAPVRSSRLESRPLETRPIPPAPVASAPPPVAAASPAAQPAAASPKPAPKPAPAPQAAPAVTVPPVAAAPAVRSSSQSKARFTWPARGSITKRFGDPKSLGIAIAGRRGDPVSAAADGKVIFSGLGPKGYGKLLIVKHDGELLSVYANNSSLLVREGQAVRQGDKIAELGTSGAGKAGLHFEIRRQGKPVDPLPYLPKR